MQHFRTLVVAPLCILIAASACSVTPGVSRSTEPEEDEPVAKPELRVREIPVETQKPDEPSAETPATAPLSADRVAELLAALPALPQPEVDEPRIEEGPAAPPRPGETVERAFPPRGPADDAAPTPAPVDLEVQRFAPEGEVDLAPYVSVTFSQPMVALTTQDTAAERVPVELSPRPAGAWRWLGTRTVVFESEGRLPAATRYRLSVPSGTRSAIGGALDEAFSTEFATPPPRLVASHPRSDTPQTLTPLIVLGFDQRVDDEAVLAHATLRDASNGDEIPLRLAADAELAEDEAAANVAKRFDEERRVLLRPRDALTRATRYRLVLAEGLPSAEGPRVTTSEQSLELRTYGPLRIEEVRCGWGAECTPSDPWSVTLTNEIDEATFDEEGLRIEPEVDDVRARASGRRITVQGAFAENTTYRLTLPETLRDVFGQPLEDGAPLVFDVGRARRELRGPGGFVTIPAGRPATVPVSAKGFEQVRVTLYRVRTDAWPAWQEALREWYRSGRRPSNLAPPGRKIFSRAVDVPPPSEGRWSEVPIELDEALEGASTGHAIVIVEPMGGKDARRRATQAFWAQVTGLGVTTFVDADELVAWASRLDDGSAVADASVKLVDGASAMAERATDGTGLARLARPARGEAARSRRSETRLVVRSGSDVALVPQRWGFTKVDRDDSLYAMIFDDRGLYRPGETARVKGWLRRLPQRPEADLELPRDAGERALTWTLRSSRGIDMAEGSGQLGELGGFDLQIEIPESADLGTAQLIVRFAATGRNQRPWTHALRIEEFRRPDFEVATELVDAGPHFVGDEIEVEARASYYAGGGLAHADTSWNVRATASRYRPPGWDRYSFGPWSPWWRSWPGPDEGDSITTTLEAKTDALGTHRVGVTLDELPEPRPWSVEAEASVLDVNRQSFAARTSTMVHPGNAYVGLRSGRGFVEADEPVSVEAIAVDVDGATLGGLDVTIEMVRLEWNRKGGEWVEEELDPRSCELVSTDESQSCAFQPSEGGRHRVRAEVLDGEGRRNRTEIMVWVAGAERPSAERLEAQEATLVPNHEEYAPGDVAEILVVSPFAPAEGVVTVERMGIERQERFRLDEPTGVVRVPIEEFHAPRVPVSVELVGETAYASGRVELDVSLAPRTLTVTATPRDAELEPGGSTVIDLSVVDAEGRGVEGASVALVVADEAVLALTGYELPDPLEVFYEMRPNGVSTSHSRSSVILTAEPEVAGEPASPDMPEPLEPQADDFAAAPTAARAMESAAVGGEGEVTAKNGGDRGGEGVTGTVPRADFSPLALFEPDVRTNAAGRSTVRLRLPDSLTRYRIMAVAAEGARRFGAGESTVTASLPLMLRPTLPRFLSYGDEPELPFVVQNATDEARDVELVAAARGLRFDGDGGASDAAGRRVRVPANARVEVRMPATVENTGEAIVQALALAGEVRDAARVSLPVHLPATSEAFATYGSLAGDDAVLTQPVAPPRDAIPRFGELSVSLSSTQMQALTDAVIYLVDYPFECAEQLASRILAISALRTVLEAFEAPGLPSEAALDGALRRDVRKLVALQRWDGGFALWGSSRESWPFASAHAGHALARASREGYPVPRGALRDVTRYLRQLARGVSTEMTKSASYALRAYAIFALRELDASAPDDAERLVAEAGDDLPVEAAAWLLPTLRDADRAQADMLVRQIENRVVETAAGAQIVTRYDDGRHLLMHSARRSDAVVLDALLRVHRTSEELDLETKLVRGLLAARTKGRWQGTQENALVLLALERAFRTLEDVTPDFVARAWLGESFAGEERFEGRSTKTTRLAVPMKRLIEESDDEVPLVLAKQGPGRLYYRLGLRYAPSSLQLDPAERGFSVTRRYEPVDDPDDVSREDDGTWTIRAGARVRVRISMVAPSVRYHVALVDPLPAGLEPLNPALETTGFIPEDDAGRDDDTPRYWWRPRWYVHDNLRDERAEAFATVLPAGVYEYVYVARATIPGRYTAAPSKAEEMYAPETFGRSGTARVVVR